MNYPLDQNIVRFYQEMGFTQPQIRRAHDYSLRTGADILDTLNNMQQQSQQPPQMPPKQQNNYVQQPQNVPNDNHKSGVSFLVPLNKIKASDYEVLFSRSSKQMQSSAKIELRQAQNPVGLLNVSNCCYLNSLLQCYFLMNSFKVAILTAEPIPNIEKVLPNQSKTKIKRIKSQYELLAKLKWFFTKMSLTSKKYLDPTTVLQNLVDSVGQKVSYGEQKDLSQINILITQRLSEGLTYSKTNFPMQQQNLISFQTKPNSQKEPKQPYNSIFKPSQGSIKKLFYGTKAEYYLNRSQMKQAPIVSDFTGLILNPRAGNLYKALDDQLNFQVQIDGGIHKKVAYIRDEPEYLFLYINRTQYDREEGHTLKNKHKFNFDFLIYLDRYLEKYRGQQSVTNEKIRELLAVKQKLKNQLNNLQLLYKKVQQCHKYAQQLQGWSQRLPNDEQFEEQFENLEQKLQQVEQQLNKIQSRRQQYHLMYIFVHRGDAVSGHYWGYGKNDATWYRFDINTKKIQQDQIIIDLQKSAATPYALLYVKQQNLPKFQYKIWNEHSAEFKADSYPSTDFRHNLEPRLVREIITQNQQIYNQFLLRCNKVIKNKTSSQYVSRYNLIKKLGKKYNQQRANHKYLNNVDLVNNFSLFLWSKGQSQLCKFTLFQQALLSASNSKFTVDKLMQNTLLLQKIQKKFKNQCKGEYYLKSYALLPKEIEKFLKLAQQYQLCAFEVIWSVVILNEADLFLEQWIKQKAKCSQIPLPIQENIKNRVLRLLKWVRIRENLVRSEQYRTACQFLGESLWISLINRQIIAMILFQIELLGVKLASLQSYLNLSQIIGSQLALINAGNSYEIDEKSIDIFGYQTAIDLISKFNDNMAQKASNQTNSVNSAAKTGNQKRISRQQGEGSPSKSAAIVKSSAKEKKNQQRLTFSPKPIFILQNKECWKLEQLQKCQLNYDLNSRLLQFLKKLGPIREAYQKILSGGKVWTISQLKDYGLAVNRVQKLVLPKQPQQSLI